MGKQCEKCVILCWEGMAWTVITITFVIVWYCLIIVWYCVWIKSSSVNTVKDKSEGEEMDHYNVRSHRCEILPQPELTRQHQECLAYRGAKDIEEVLSTDANEIFYIKGSSPDSFVINEYYV